MSSSPVSTKLARTGDVGQFPVPDSLATNVYIVNNRPPDNNNSRVFPVNDCPTVEVRVVPSPTCVRNPHTVSNTSTVGLRTATPTGGKTCMSECRSVTEVETCDRGSLVNISEPTKCQVAAVPLVPTKDDSHQVSAVYPAAQRSHNNDDVHAAGNQVNELGGLSDRSGRPGHDKLASAPVIIISPPPEARVDPHPLIRESKTETFSHRDDHPPYVPFPSLRELDLEDLGTISVRRCEGYSYTMPIEIQGKEFEAILDTAAEVSVLSLELYNSLPQRPKFDAKVRLKGIGGGVTMSYRCSVPLLIGDTLFNWPVYICENEDDLLLGLDFMKSNGFVIDMVNDVAHVKDQRLPLTLIQTNIKEHVIRKVTVVKRRMLPPHSHTPVKVKLPPNLDPNKEYCISSSSLRRGLLVGSTLVRGGSEAYVSVINDSDNFIPIKKSVVVGDVQEVLQVIEEETGDPLTSSPDECMPAEPACINSTSSLPDPVTRVDLEPQSLDPHARVDPGGVNTDPNADCSLNTESSNSIPEELDEDEPEELAWVRDFINKAKSSQESGNDQDPAEWDRVAESIRNLDLISQAMPEHLEKMFRDNTSNLNVEQAIRFGLLLLRYQDIFSTHDYDIGCFEGVEHHIDTGPHPPIKQKMRRMVMALQEKEKAHLEQMLEMGIVEPSNSEWASPPVLVKKADGSSRYCIDFRRLNECTVKDSYPLPIIEDCLDTLAGNSWFSALDMSWGYHQIPMAEGSRSKTAFPTRYGLFHFCRMPFGLCNSPATFQRAINLVLRGMTWKEVLAYLDDVLILGVSFDNHLVNLELVFQRFRDAGLKLKPRKCKFFQREMEFLGKVISDKGVTISPSKIVAVQEWPIPTSKKETQAWLGFVNYHREHLPGLAELLAPIYELVGPHSEFRWTDEHTERFQQVKGLISSAPCLAYPMGSGTFVLDTDASDVSIGACLSQVQDGVERPIAFASHSLLKAQKRYCTTRKELLSLVHFTRHFRHYLLGRPFLVRTDHHSLIWLMRFKNAEGQLARWLEELAQYDMKITHRAGAKHQNADGMSRIPDSLEPCQSFDIGVAPSELPCGGCPYCVRAEKQWGSYFESVENVVPWGKVSTLGLDDVPDLGLAELFTVSDPPSLPSSPSPSGPNPSDVPQPRPSGPVAHTVSGDSESHLENLRSLGYSMHDIREAQLRDPDLKPVFRWLRAGRDPEGHELFLHSADTKKIWQAKGLLTIDQGILYHKWVAQPHDRYLLVAPRSLREEIFKYCHDVKAVGHPGMDKTLERVRQKFHWPFMQRDIQNWVRACNVCNHNKKSRTRQAELRRHHAGLPMERVHLDLIGPLVKSEQGNQYILVMVDQFTKWVECAALPDQTASTVAYQFLAQFVRYFGCPQVVHTDQGRNFEGNVFQAFCELMEIHKTRTTPYHPQGNGQCETKNRLILQMIRCYVDKKGKDWDYYLPFICLAFHSLVNRTTGFTPNKLMLGREVTLPVDLMFETWEPNRYTHLEWVEHIGREFVEAQKFARAYIRANQLRQKHAYDRKASELKYKVGDAVLRRESTTKKGAKALSSPWVGPFIVVDTHPPVYTLQSKRKTFTVHHDLLKPCKSKTLPIWLRQRQNNILDLDETIAYDQEEVDLDPGPCVPAAPMPPTRPSGPQKPMQPKPKAKPPVVQIQAPAPPDPPVVAPRTTRTGRQTKPPARFQDYTTS